MQLRSVQRPALTPVLTFLAACALAVPTFAADIPHIPAPAAAIPAPATTPEALEQRLAGKTLFLRGFYLDDHLEFDTTGKVVGAPQRGSFTLASLEIKKVRFTKKTMEIEADRIGLHFFGALPYESDARPYEALKVSKKPVAITIDRLVIEPEKKKKKNKHDAETAKNESAKNAPTDPDYNQQQGVAATDETEGTVTTISDETAAAPATGPMTPAAAALSHDPRQSYVVLSAALDKIFAPGLDDSVIATLPDYWQNYFATKAGKVREAALDASALHPGGDVRAPHLLTNIDPDSNDYAQKNNIAGMIMLQTVVSASGKPGQVTIMRPIGFGLDEKAVEAVEKSQFQPGTKDGKPVPVVVNLQVTFRIYSEQTRPRPGAPAAAAPVQVGAKQIPAPPVASSGTTTVAAATVNR